MSWCQSRGLAVQARHRKPALRRQNPRLAEHTLGGAAESMTCGVAAGALVGCSPGCRPGSEESAAEGEDGECDDDRCPEAEHPFEQVALELAQALGQLFAQRFP